MSLRAVLVVVLFGTACTPAANPIASQPDGDPETFARDVQPVLVRHCAFVGCHGREGMPLTLFAVDFLRLRDPNGEVDPAVPALDERALSEVELTHNRRSLAARAGNNNRLIRKLIPTEKGGIPHFDVVVFESEDHPDAVILKQWLGTVRDAQ